MDFGEVGVNKGFIKESTIKVGNKYTNNCGHEFIVLNYISSSVKTGGILIQFTNTNAIRLCNGSDLLKGEVKDLMQPTVCGIGFIGNGEYSASDCGKKNPYYLYWHNMLKRCYEKSPRHAVSYEGCVVDGPWHNLQIFADWCTCQRLYGKLPLGMGVALDKDILVPNNKIYSKDTCLIVPSEINTAIVGKHKGGKKHNLPCGVFKYGNKYVVHCFDKSVRNFRSLLDASAFYAEHKQQRILYLLNKYQDYLDDKTISALTNFNVGEREMYN